VAHWAEIDENNIVLQVIVADNNDPEGDEGYKWLINNLGGTWVKTSYNAVAGKYRNPETNEITDQPGFRKNFAGIGFTYDSDRDAFIAPKPHNSWVIDEDTCLWKAPVAYPNDEGIYTWNESTLSWDPAE
jgi:hypothetical protein